MTKPHAARPRIEARRVVAPDKKLWDYLFRIIDVALENVPEIEDPLHGPVQRRTWPTKYMKVVLDREVTVDEDEPRNHRLTATPKASRKPGNTVEFVEDREVVTKATGPAVDSRTASLQDQERWMQLHLEPIFQTYPNLLDRMLERAGGPSLAVLEENPRIGDE